MQGSRLRGIWWLFPLLVVLGASLASVLGQTEEPVQALLERLRSPDEATRNAAAETLTVRAFQNLEQVLPVLTKALNDPDPNVRFYSTVALFGAAYGDEENARRLHRAVPALSEGLSDEDPRVRAAAANAITTVMPHPPAAVTAPLLRALGDPEREVREAALDALARVRPVALQTAPAVLRVLREDPSPGARGAAARTLGEIETAHPSVTQALIDALHDADRFVRQEAVRALARIGPPARAAIPDLTRIVGNPSEDATVRALATDALRRISR